jgi:hypothetical protein
MQSASFKARAKAFRERIFRDVDAGKPLPSLDEIARELRLPLDAVEGGLQHSLQKYLLRNTPISGASN